MNNKGINGLASAFFAFLLMSVAYPAIGEELLVPEGRAPLMTEEALMALQPGSFNPNHANEEAWLFSDGSKNKAITRTNIAVSEEVQRGGGGFNIPTGAPPSPLNFGTGVLPFDQQLLRFEEFGTKPLLPYSDPAYSSTFTPLPYPVTHQSFGGTASGLSPNWTALDAFLNQDIYPYPMIEANVSDANPWNTGASAGYADISGFLGAVNGHGPAEGRPGGVNWAHQRINNPDGYLNPSSTSGYEAKVYFQTAQAGARTNTGRRNGLQMHSYTVGEFGPLGLYNDTTGGGQLSTTSGIGIKFHPQMPLQEEQSLFTFDGTLPPKLLMARYGEGILFRHYNALPIDPSANRGFGLHTITTHEHNGHTPAESDGYTNAFFFPGQYYDYRWPIVLAGHDSINTGATNPWAGTPVTLGSAEDTADGSADGIRNIPGDYRETMSTHWFHDHMLDFTASNVYKGNAAMMNYYSSIDRGNEGFNCRDANATNPNLCFPSGTGLDWGNRDYDVNLLIAAKAWDNQGQLFFNPFNTDGFLGDRMMVNWLYKPYMDVRARQYRLRLLNGSVSRYLKLAIVTETGTPVPFHMIANDGNIMKHSVKFTNGILPTQAIAERYDIIIDFSQFAVGTKLYILNVLEHEDGRGPEKDAVPLNQVWAGAMLADNVAAPPGAYHASIDPVKNEWTGGDPVIGTVLEFRVQGYSGTDLSMNPADYEDKPGGKVMLELPPFEFTQAELDSAVHRTFDFGRSSGTDEAPWTIKTDGGMGYNMDPRRLSAAPDIDPADLNDIEIWHLSTGGGWSHPIHIHFEEGKILSRDGMMPPVWETLSRKDVYRIGPEVDSSREMTVALRFREFKGTYMEHCHNTQHEDTAMLMRYDIEEVGAVTLLPTPMPSWNGVGSAPSYALATYKTGDVNATLEIPTLPANGGDVDHDGVIDRIFSDAQLRLKSPPAMELVQVPDMQHILDEYIANPAMAVALGKAFFWDTTVGSDGQACASCHFSAGADSRSKNQLHPGPLNVFDPTNTGAGGINYQLVSGDFPFPKGLDDITGSQGTVDAALVTGRVRPPRDGSDVCTNLPSDFTLASLLHRKTTGRNTPSVINAVFNHRNFWDGRANNMFNGVDPHGARTNMSNPGQGIWTYNIATGPVKEQVLIKNSSLAGQAVGPANNTTEMACAGRIFPLLGRKMLPRVALANQVVSRSDSVLGSMTGRRGGLRYRYLDMIRMAFKSKYWGAPITTRVENGFTQFEANFSLFWGLAIQMYEATLVSNMTPYDAFARGDNTALTEQEKLGLEVFFREDRASCGSCHNGSAFTNATVAHRALAPDGGAIEVAEMAVEPPEPFERMRMGDRNPSLYDGGYYNIGVTATDADKCIGADLGGYPLSYSGQAVTGNIVDAEANEHAAGGEDDFVVVGGPVVAGSGERLGVDGSCKTPSLRNVELTAPYFHNGSHLTLEQATTSYMLKFQHLYANENLENLAPEILKVDIGGLAFDGVSIRGGELEALVAFMKTLTDERVRLHKAPFDHPSLVIFNGSTGADVSPSDGRADDIRTTLPAVGAGGYAAPLAQFPDF